jgi:hypothetical protein
MQTPAQCFLTKIHYVITLLGVPVSQHWHAVICLVHDRKRVRGILRCKYVIVIQGGHLKYCLLLSVAVLKLKEGDVGVPDRTVGQSDGLSQTPIFWH